MSILGDFTAKVQSINKVPELKKKIFYTLLMFLVTRIGAHIPAPGVDVTGLTNLIKNDHGLLSMMNMFSGGAFTRASIFALGVLPYIDASIIMQLLGVVVPQIEEMQKEGDSGRQKIVQWTRYLTIIIGIVQSFGVAVWLYSSGMSTSDNAPLFIFTTIVIMTAGTVFLMWLGEQITVYGIGNGISTIIFLNIVVRVPSTFYQLFQIMRGQTISLMILEVGFLIALAVAMVIFIVIFQLGQRKIPIQYAGKGFGGKNSIAAKTYLPLKVNTAGVIPVIFASVILMMPGLLTRIIPATNTKFLGISMLSIKSVMTTVFGINSPIYLVLYALIIIFFTFFYTAVVFDPEKVAENLKKSGGTIPGIRPGQETVEYLERVVMRITFCGAIFLAFIALLPKLVSMAMHTYISITGVSILIIVGVALDTVSQINANLVMREYEGFIS